jgi:hypothetical protein
MANGGQDMLDELYKENQLLKERYIEDYPFLKLL